MGFMGVFAWGMSKEKYHMIYPGYEDVKKIVETFTASFDKFKDDKEVFQVLGIEENAKRKTAARMLYLVQQGKTIEEAYQIISEEIALVQAANEDEAS